MKKRIFYKDNTTLNDYSVNLQDFHNGTQSISFVDSEDKLYIGSFLPFNHFKVIMGTTVNAEASYAVILPWVVVSLGARN